MIFLHKREHLFKVESFLFFSLGSKSAVILRARDKVGPGPPLLLMPLMNGIGRAAHAGHEPGTGWAPMGPTSRVCQPARVNRARQCAPPVPGTPSTTSCRAPACRQPALLRHAAAMRRTTGGVSQCGGWRGGEGGGARPGTRALGCHHWHARHPPAVSNASLLPPLPLRGELNVTFSRFST